MDSEPKQSTSDEQATTGEQEQEGAAPTEESRCTCSDSEYDARDSDDRACAYTLARIPCAVHGR